MNDLLNRLHDIEQEASSGLSGVKTTEDLKVFRSRFVGKQGAVTELLKLLGTLPQEDRPSAGKKINDLKNLLLEKIDGLEKELQDRAIGKNLSVSVDITLPGRVAARPGKLHPVTQVMGEIIGIFTKLGFSVFEGPEIETDYYNFEALNMPKNHPARDMQDTFYVKSGGQNSSPLGDDFLLRTHTSPVQIHVMEKYRPPISMIFPGAVYRKDADVTHSPMFHQVEGLMVGDDIRMSDLKGVLTEFIHQMFGGDVGVRFRPSFFPFTEPSAEVDIRCVMCGGKAVLQNGESCKVCKGTGWMEILGSGMVDPNVFKAVGYDAKKFKGFAFGMGVERIAMLKFGISDIRMFFENDVRFLRQF